MTDTTTLKVEGRTVQVALNPADVLRLAVVLTHADNQGQTVHLLLDPDEGSTAGLWVSLDSGGYTTVEHAADHLEDKR